MFSIMKFLYIRICGPRGVTAVAKCFQGVTLRGKEHEKSDLDMILSKMEHWAHRLFPKLPFDDCVEQIAKLGNNRSVQVLKKMLYSVNPIFIYCLFIFRFT